MHTNCCVHYNSPLCHNLSSQGHFFFQNVNKITPLLYHLLTFWCEQIPLSEFSVFLVLPLIRLWQWGKFRRNFHQLSATSRVERFHDSFYTEKDLHQLENFLDISFLPWKIVDCLCWLSTSPISLPHCAVGHTNRAAWEMFQCLSWDLLPVNLIQHRAGVTNLHVTRPVFSGTR